MPGPVSDSFDPEWGTSSNAEEISDALKAMYEKCSQIIAHGIGPGRDPKPMNILQLVRSPELSTRITTSLKEQEWRILRFALERAIESI